MNLRKNHVPSIDVYDSIDVNADEDGMLISRYESYRGKEEFNMVIINREEAKKLLEILQEKLS